MKSAVWGIFLGFEVRVTTFGHAADSQSRSNLIQRVTQAQQRNTQPFFLAARCAATLHHLDYRAGMAISTTTRKVILDGEPIPSPSHHRLLTLFHLLCSGIIHSFSGASLSTQLNHTGSLTTSPQAAAWYTVQVGSAHFFVAIFELDGISSGLSTRMGLKPRRRSGQNRWRH